MEDRNSAPRHRDLLALVVAYLPLAVGCLAAVLLPPLGFCFGIVLLFFRRRNQGIAVVALSIVVGVIFLISASNDDDKADLSPGVARRAKALTRCLTEAPLNQDVEERMQICERRLNFKGLEP